MPVKISLKSSTFFSTFFHRERVLLLFVFLICSAFKSEAQRIPVLNQIDLPHNYYFRELYLPQLTSGPSSVSWTSDGKSLIYAMAGSLWIQEVGSETATQLTDGPGYDFQPDCSPNGKNVVYTRYNGQSVELMSLDLLTKQSTELTKNKGVNLEPRWSPDGKKLAYVSTMNTGHFLLYTAEMNNGVLEKNQCITPDRKSIAKRYYYSEFDHAINPFWSTDGEELFFISNREIAHGTGAIVSLSPGHDSIPKIIHQEETSWNTKPDISPDGTRMVYSSYLGRNWHQLWLLPSKGGYPVALTYGDYDNTNARWSPDGSKIAFISNRTGNMTLWTIDPYNGKEQEIKNPKLIYKNPVASLTVITLDENGSEQPARVSVCDSRGKFYSPRESWIHADDSTYPAAQKFESHYIHSQGKITLNVPNDSVYIVASSGPEYEISKQKISKLAKSLDTISIKLSKLKMPLEYGNWKSGDLHVHMNYTGHYRNTPENLVQQAKAENLNFMYNLIVNKEQRIPDISYFSPSSDPASTSEVLLFHSQEFHTSFWGHLGLLNLDDHFLVPSYSAYPETAFQSLYPHNVNIAKQAKAQNALVGYVHPFLASQLYPEQSESLTNDLPLNAALGLVDYYELIGFADHIPSADVWYKLLNCGMRIPAGAGTDAMANYASLRGPVGLNRIFIKNDGVFDKKEIVKQIKKGRSYVTNGPLIGLNVEDVEYGDVVQLKNKSEKISYSAFVRSAVAVDYLDIIWNGKVVKRHIMKGSKKEIDIKGKFAANGPGWMLARAWSEKADPDLFDSYPYASTNPIYFEVDGKYVISKEAASYFLIWIERLKKAAMNHEGYRDEREKEIVLNDIELARQFYLECINNSTMP